MKGYSYWKKVESTPWKVTMISRISTFSGIWEDERERKRLVRRVAAGRWKGWEQRREWNPCETMVVVVAVVGHAAMTALTALTAVHAALTVTGNTDFDLLALFVLLGSKTNQPTHTMKNREIEQFRNRERRDCDRLLLIVEQIQ